MVIGGDVHGDAKTYGSGNVVNIKGKLHGKRYDEENDGSFENGTVCVPYINCHYFHFL